jgi:hypothetical protein
MEDDFIPKVELRASLGNVYPGNGLGSIAGPLDLLFAFKPK